jgi:hypothetical protein
VCVCVVPCCNPTLHASSSSSTVVGRASSSKSLPLEFPFPFKKRPCIDTHTCARAQRENDPEKVSCWHPRWPCDPCIAFDLFALRFAPSPGLSLGGREQCVGKRSSASTIRQPLSMLTARSGCATMISKCNHRGHISTKPNFRTFLPHPIVVCVCVCVHRYTRSHSPLFTRIPTHAGRADVIRALAKAKANINTRSNMGGTNIYKMCVCVYERKCVWYVYMCMLVCLTFFYLSISPTHTQAQHSCMQPTTDTQSA